MRGSWVLVRMRGDRYDSKKVNWLFIKHRDSHAVAGPSDLMHEDRSVASGRSLDEIARGVGKPPKPFMLASRQLAKVVKQAKPVGVARMPAFVEPQLCRLVEQPASGPLWAHEVKLDGYRAQLRVQRRAVAIRTRTGLNWTERFKAIAENARGLPDCLIDGEVVALDERRLPSFGALQAALSAGNSQSLTFFAFDLLFEGREDLRGLPLEQRKTRLTTLLAAHPELSHLHYLAHLVSNPQDILASAREMGLEGIVSKRLDSVYRSGRSDGWTKTKCRPRQEIVIGGWTSEGGSVRSLLAGVYRDRQFRYVGRVGTGFGRSVAKALSPRLQALTRDESPFDGDNAPRKERNVRWVEPKLLAEIEFAGWTTTGMIRQAAFQGIREDKAPREVEVEAALRAIPARHTAAPASRVGAPQSVFGVTISSPQKSLWPQGSKGAPITKIDLARYYEQIGDWMLPHLIGRPCSLLRVPDGLGGEEFFQRHAMAGMSKWVSSIKIRGDKAPYIQIDRLEGLAAVAQMGAIELHPWNCGVDDPEVAGRLVFDLDPAPDVTFDAVITAALEVRDRLKAVGLECFCKTTGGKGLHVVSPLTGGKDAIEWPMAKNFAHIVCAQMTADSPHQYLDNMSKQQRVGKIFLDYLRNDRTSTAVAVLSPRARPGAPVSMPIHWKQVRPGLDGTAYTLENATAVLRKNRPWEEYAESARSLSAAIERVAHPTKRRRRRSGSDA